MFGETCMHVFPASSDAHRAERQRRHTAERHPPRAMPRLNFAPNITKSNSRWPPTISWDEVCASRGTISGEDSHYHVGRKPSRHSDVSVARLNALSDRSVAKAFVGRLERDIAARRVLCDANSPCRANVRTTPRRGLVVEVCLPATPLPTAPAGASANHSRKPVVCEPYGEMWQQYAHAKQCKDSKAAHVPRARRRAPVLATDRTCAHARCTREMHAHIHSLHDLSIGCAGSVGRYRASMASSPRATSCSARVRRARPLSERATSNQPSPTSASSMRRTRPQRRCAGQTVRRLSCARSLNGSSSCVLRRHSFAATRPPPKYFRASGGARAEVASAQRTRTRPTPRNGKLSRIGWRRRLRRHVLPNWDQGDMARARS